MTPEQMKHYLAVYRDGLLHDTLPFWFPRCVDPEHGGYFSSFDQDGSLLQSDKAVWLQGRIVWLLSTLCNTVERRADWLAWAKSGVDFLNRHCFDTDGQMFFLMTREGRPLRKRRYVFSESFAVIALAQYGKAAQEPRYIQQALELFKRMVRTVDTPGALPPKTNPEVRPMKGLALPMILTVTAQELRKVVDDPFCTQVIDRSIADIERDFMKPEFKCLLETVGPRGECYDTFDGRMVNPGHSIEAGWFILEEARLRKNDPRLLQLGLTIVDWAFEIGWDAEYGGLYYFRDAKGLPCSEYWHDMKFWWPHNEAIIANLLAWQLTGDPKYSRRHAMTHDWAYAHFPDPVHGEWYGYLHRDGRLSTRIKGNVWKGPFHLGRMQWYCWQRLKEACSHS